MWKKKNNEKAHFEGLMYHLIKSSKNNDELPIGFHRSITIHEKEITKIKTTERNYQVSPYLKVVYDFDEHREKATYGKRYKKTVQGSKDNNL